MAQYRKLETDRDFQEAMERQHPLRVFRDDYVIDSGGVIVRFDNRTVVVQTGVGDIAYHPRQECEFFETRRRPS
ncbi:hypothetical protein ABEV74_03820 [Paenibacillus cisolokensis]|uniref:Uncharacterized protein n=1 Tax=Paenibacillus cisolokensis TaxID=1658519 RepID=A0ABQ4N373_9BACL|nr:MULTISPECIES: hypothetical protein [Paenibacillus]ALS30181.1 hypothetical protein IJ21_48200 [Paenibacillus sp. 32O-W]GIQ62649.1 hypothetical protein PACILC2_12170 [Paenibacillus cisolokensis]